jgi:predicted PurR-regulated permease PerM
MVRRQATTVFLLIVAAVSLYLCYLIAEPFLSAIFAAIVMAIVFYPLYARIERRMQRPNTAATLATILVLLTVAIPAVFLGVTVTSELGDLYKSLSQKSAAEGGLNPYVMHLMERPLQLIGRYVDLSRIDLRATLLRGVEQASRYLVSYGATAVSNVFSLVLDTVVAFFTLFFLFREGRSIQQRTAAALPLSREQAERLFIGINDTIVASVYGSIAVGVVQGALTGLAFWVLGVSSPILWGLAAAMASLVPFVGTAMVWAPAAIWLMATGHLVKGLILLGWGAAVVAQVDALVRPYVVSGRVKVHSLLIFFALLGGVKAFGIMGIFIGPVVLSVTVAVLDMMREMNVAGVPVEPTPVASEVAE